MTDMSSPAQDKLAEIEAILEKNAWLPLGESEWLIREVKRLCDINKGQPDDR